MIECKGYKYWTDCGYEYACGYDAEHSCEECICCGGLYNPRTNKKATSIVRITNFIQQWLSGFDIKMPSPKSIEIDFR